MKNTPNKPLQYYLINESDYTIIQTNLDNPDPFVGKKCYQAIFGLNKPCSESGYACPKNHLVNPNYCYTLRNLTEIGLKNTHILSTTIETHDNKYLFNYFTNFYENADEKTVSEQQLLLIRSLIQKYQTTKHELDEVILKEETTKKLFDAFFKNSQLAFFLSDDKANIIKTNHAAQKMLGYTPEELATKKYHDLIKKEDITVAEKNLNVIKQKGKVSVKQRIFTTKDGAEVIAEVEGLKVNEKTIITCCKDITRENYYIEQLEATNKKLEEIQQQQARLIDELYKAKTKAEAGEQLKTVFLRNLSHEIRTPLNGIIGFSAIVNQDMPPEKHQQFMKIINDSGKQLLNVINDIIDIALIEANQMKLFNEEFDLISFLHNAYQFYQSVYKNTINQDVSYHFAPDHNLQRAVIKTDKTRLQQVVKALISNAFKFTQQGQIEFGYTTTNTHFCIFVKDTGIGIAPENFELIFHSFNQVEKHLSRKYGGTGIGLSIVKGILDKMEFSIKLESQLGQGSIFTVLIPLTKIISTTTTPINIQLDTKQRKKILLIEDNEQNAELITEILNKYFDITITESGEAALALPNLQQFSLVLMDIRLPGIDGIETTRQLKARYPEISIIMQTAHALPETKQKSFDAGAELFLTKPIDALQLEQIVVDFFTKKQNNNSKK